MGLLVSGCAGDNHVKVLSSNGTGSSQQADFFQWHDVQEGLSYANILVDVDGENRKEFFVVKVNPRLFEFRIYENKDRANVKTIRQIQKESGSVLSFNGAFFDTQFKAMGLLEDSQKLWHNILQSDLMNGIFYVACRSMPEYREIPQLQSLKDYVRPVQENFPQKNCGFWIQNGPILVDNIGGIRISKDTGKSAARTALGIDKDGNVAVIILHQSLLNTDNTLSLYQFAHSLKEDEPFKSMGLHSVLNLDGGPSTGVMVAGEYLPEINNVQNVVITLPRKDKI